MNDPRITALIDIFLTDPIFDEEVRIIAIKGAESDLDHLQIHTQTRDQHESGIMTVHKIYTSEEEHKE